MITVVASIASYYCAASIGIGHIFNLANHKKAVPIVGIIAFSVALFIDTPEELKVISTFTDKFTYIFIVVLPRILFLVTLSSNDLTQCSLGRRRIFLDNESKDHLGQFLFSL